MMTNTILLVALCCFAGSRASPMGQQTSSPTLPTPVPPTKPPLNTSTAPVTTLPPTPTIPVDDCSTRTVCVDGINDCGEPWGTCIPDCRPWDITTPPCSTFTPPPMCDDREPGQEIILCKDFIDACHHMYGGCYDVCKPEPSWVTPYCDKVWPTDGSFWEPEPGLEFDPDFESQE